MDKNDFLKSISLFREINDTEFKDLSVYGIIAQIVSQKKFK